MHVQAVGGRSLRIALEERLVYRGDFALGTLMRFLPIVTQIFLWWAIFDTIGDGDVIDGDIVGYSFHNVVAYYLLTMLSRAFSSMPGLASGIALQIRNGEIKKFLVQPIDMLGFLCSRAWPTKWPIIRSRCCRSRLSFSCAAAISLAGPVHRPLPPFVLTLMMAFVLGFFLEATIGLIGFWFLEVSSFLFVYMLFSFFLSGHMFPLDMLPRPGLRLSTVAVEVPGLFPVGRVSGQGAGPSSCVRGLWIEAAWIVIFIVAAARHVSRGVRRYSGYGG